VDWTTIDPSSTRQNDVSPSQPLSVFPSNMEIQPEWSLKSTGSGWEKPPPPPCPAAVGALEAPTEGTVGCCGKAGTTNRIETARHAPGIIVALVDFIRLITIHLRR
jgi:hypothetical protein